MSDDSLVIPATPFCMLPNGLPAALDMARLNVAQFGMILISLPYAFTGRTEIEDNLARIDLTEKDWNALISHSKKAKDTRESLVQRGILYKSEKNRYFIQLDLSKWLDKDCFTKMFIGKVADDLKKMLAIAAKWKPNKRAEKAPLQGQEAPTQGQENPHRGAEQPLHRGKKPPQGGRQGSPEPKNSPEEAAYIQDLTTEVKETTNRAILAYAREVCLLNSQKDMRLISGFASKDPHKTIDLLHCFAVTKKTKPGQIKVDGKWLNGLWTDGFVPVADNPQVPRMEDFLAREETAARQEIAEQDEKQKRLEESGNRQLQRELDAEKLRAKLEAKHDENERVEALAASFASRDSKQHDEILREFENGKDWRSASHLKAWITAGKPDTAEESGWKFIPILAEAEEIFLKCIQPEIDKLNAQASAAKAAGSPEVAQ